MASQPNSAANSGARRPPPPVRTQSKFTEGSMNDRISAVPPVQFLGLADEEAFCHAFQLRQPDPRPRSASAQTQPPASVKEKKGFLAPLWDGFREKLHLSTKTGKQRPLSVDGKLVEAKMAMAMPGAGPDAAGPPRPTRDEVMQSYQQLASSGFFGNRAIPSMRQPPPVAPATTQDISAVPPLEDTSARTSEDTIVPVDPLRSNPVPHTSSIGAIDPHRSWLLPPSRDSVTAGTEDWSAPPSRGMKRPHEGEDLSKAAKKIRKSASKLSVDLVPALRRQRGAQQQLSQPPLPPPHAPAPPPTTTRHNILTRRSFSSGNRETNKLAKRNPRAGATHSRPSSSSGQSNIRGAISGPITPVVKLPPGAFDALRAEAPATATSLWATQQQPQRDRRAEPLSVVPDANRGIPTVPRIPDRFMKRRGIAGQGRENSENIEAWRMLPS